MATTEIEKLERRYAENPQGLTFAPLAEVHRKNGDVSRALELLRAGLELHPNYIPASIVLGRCHWDLGDLPAAESAFAHVLRLDDENVIALKSLADINERLERLGEAQRWLNRLISVDRNNEEARQQLARLETAKQQIDRRSAPATPAAPADLPHEIAAAAPASAPATPVEPSPAATAAPTRAAMAGPTASDPPPLDLTSAIAEPESAPPAPPEPEPAAPAPAAESTSSTLEFLDTSPAPPSQPEDVRDEGAAVEGLISQEFVPPKGTSFPLHPELAQEVRSVDERFEQLEVETAEEVELQSSGASEFRVPNAAEDFLDFAAQMSPRDESSVHPGPASVPEPAAGDERPLPDERPRPDEIVLPSTPPGERDRNAPEPMRPSYAVGDTKGQSVASFFAALLAARPAGASGGLADQGSPPAAQPRPTEEAPVSVPNASLDAAVSFDEFFGSTPAGSSPVPQTNPNPGKDDLDQFQSWLQNLKR